MIYKVEQAIVLSGKLVTTLRHSSWPKLMAGNPKEQQTLLS